MDRTIAAIETALAVTLLPHFIADTSPKVKNVKRVNLTIDNPVFLSRCP